jgi:hypothetical protein
MRGTRSAGEAAPYDSLKARAEVQRPGASWWPRIDADAFYIVRDNPVEAEFGSERFSPGKGGGLAH